MSCPLQVYPARGERNLAADTPSAELAQHLPMFVCIFPRRIGLTYTAACTQGLVSWFCRARDRLSVKKSRTSFRAAKFISTPRRSTISSPIARCLRNLPLGLGRRWAGVLGCGVALDVGGTRGPSWAASVPVLGAWSVFCGRTCGPSIGRPGGRGSSNCS